MKRKIRITSKMVKKSVLWILLLALTVGLVVLVVDSFSSDQILSNNTSLKEIDYSGEYRTYLEKQLIEKEQVGDYDTIISDRILIEKDKIQIAGDEEIEKLTAKLAEDKLANKNKCDDAIARIDIDEERMIAEVEDDPSLTESAKEEQIETIKSGMQAMRNTQLLTLENENKLLQEAFDAKVADVKTNTKIDIASVNEEKVIEIIVKEIIGDKKLTEVIKQDNNTPSGYVFSLKEDLNTAINATFNSSLTEEKNTIDSVKIDTETGLTFTKDSVEYIYSGKTGSLVYDVNIPEDGFYSILVDYIPFSSASKMELASSSITEESGGAPIERQIYIDGNILFNDLANVSFVRTWGDGGEKFIDASGNEIKPTQVEIPKRNQLYVKDSVGYVNEPYLIYFSEGTHTIELKSIRENMGIANIYITSKEDYVEYSDYYEQYKNEKIVDGKIAYTLQGEGGDSIVTKKGEDPYLYSTEVIRTSSTIYGTSDRTSSYNSFIQNGKEIPASPVSIVLNTIGGSKWSTPGDWINWTVDVKESGLYHISLRAKQNVSRGLFSSRKLTIDGAVPFKEAMNCKFIYSSDWSMVTLGGEEEYYFYLEEGVHTIGLECTLGDYASQIARVQEVIDGLNSLYRKIIQKTGISPDPYMDYFKNESGKRLIAEAKERFQEAIDILYEVSDNITKISGEKSSETASLETMAVQLKQFVKDYRKIQKNLSDFSTNISSLGTWILNVSQQSLSIDYLVVHSDDYKLPKANDNFFGTLWFDVKGFFGSFFFDYESVGLTKEKKGWKTIEVWLCTSESTGREQANAISSLISQASDDPNTSLYGINVKLKVVSADVLLTATLAGRGPDVAINVGNGTPVNYALRGATKDLTMFTEENLKNYFGASRYDSQKMSSFQEIALGNELETEGGTRRFQNSAMRPFEFEGGYYGLPYTHSYLMMFYRTDMFEEYGWDIPQTWEDVVLLIPELQIMNFQFYLPLNTSGASSVVNQIFASYLYQNVEDTKQAFYRETLNAFGETYIESNFDSEEAKQAFEFWCRFYTDYSFPLSASFVNRFRSGETPIGIVNYDIYNTLAVSAPEIRGKWEFALLPGTRKDGGVIDRSGAASGMSMVMMNTTDSPYEAWTFMDWFTSADTQVNYAREIEAILGAAARHNTANVAAFTRLAWSEEEKAVLMEQWKETVGVPEVAGGYYTGRNLENAFREVVNNNYNPRQILSDYILTINSEIDRKREEFGLASSVKAADKKKGGK